MPRGDANLQTRHSRKDRLIAQETAQNAHRFSLRRARAEDFPKGRCVPPEVLAESYSKTLLSAATTFLTPAQKREALILLELHAARRLFPVACRVVFRDDSPKVRARRVRA